MLDVDLPVMLTPTNRDAHLLKMLALAADTCHRSGLRLVLVVDGLDEDVGVTADDRSYSIAALLPADPPAGLRVIVTSRPDPPLPADVEAGHPLRDPAIKRVLTRSPQAQVIRADAERGLRRLLGGDGLQRDLLGLTTAAGGGLSCADIGELTGSTEHQVRSHLHSATGRMFASRPSQWHPGSAPDVFVLAHEELQAAASEALGQRVLRVYRDAIRAWAGQYSAKAWPERTPEYLLRSYFGMLKASADTPDLLHCALDRRRHDRMLNTIGGDTAALAEISVVQEMIAARPAPDLTALTQLALYRKERIGRNDRVPSHLPAVWVVLGNPDRAEALARSMTDPIAMAHVAEALARAGQRTRAIELASESDAGRSFTSGLPALSWVAEALARAGHCGEAEAAVSSIADACGRVSGYSRLATALSGAGETSRAVAAVERARQIAESITEPEAQRWSLIRLAEALTATGQFGLAWELADSLDQLHDRELILSYLATALAAASDHNEAVRASRSIRTLPAQARSLADVAVELSKTGHIPLAIDTAKSIIEPYSKAQAFRRMATELAEGGEHAGAEEAASQAEHAARSEVEEWKRERALAWAASALAAAGHYARAETVIDSVSYPDCRAEGLADLAARLYLAGEHAHASEIAAEALATATSVTERLYRGTALDHIAKVMAGAGQYALAEAAARSQTEPHATVGALCGLAETLADAGLRSRAAEVAAETEIMARSIGEPDAHAGLLANIAAELGRTGHRAAALEVAASAEKAARSVADPEWRLEAFIKVSSMMTSLGLHPAAERAAEAAEAAARSRTDPWDQEGSLEWVATNLASTQTARALAIVHSLPDLGPSRQAELFAKAAAALAARGDAKHARQLAAQSHAAAQSIEHQRSRSIALIWAASAMSNTRQHAQAAVTARSIGDEDLRAQALANLAVWQAEHVGHGDFIEQTLAASRSAAGPDGSGPSLSGVVRALVIHGDHDRATTIANSISGPYYRGAALLAVARAQAASGHSVDAAATTELVMSAARATPILKERILGQAAVVLFTIGDLQRCTAVTVEILLSNHWEDALPILAKLDPMGLNSIAAGLSGDPSAIKA